jgi:hypothetical protein
MPEFCVQRKAEGYFVEERCEAVPFVLTLVRPTYR